jgi:hypothetical protein
MVLLPIKSVWIDFVGSSVLRMVMNKTSHAAPSSIAEYLKQYHSFKPQEECSEMKGVNLFITLDGNESEISFRIVEWQDPEMQIGNTIEPAKEVLRFKVSLPRVCGVNEWKAYQEGKAVFKGEIRNVFEGEASWNGQKNLHDALSIRLNRRLERKGLVDSILHSADDIEESSKIALTRKLITLFTDYKAIYKNSAAISRVLGFD